MNHHIADSDLVSGLIQISMIAVTGSMVTNPILCTTGLRQHR